MNKNKRIRELLKENRKLKERSKNVNCNNYWRWGKYIFNFYLLI